MILVGWLKSPPFLWSVVQYTSYTMSFFKTTKILTTALIKFSFHTLKCVEVQTKELLNSRISEVESWRLESTVRKSGECGKIDVPTRAQVIVALPRGEDMLIMKIPNTPCKTKRVPKLFLNYLLIND